MSSGLIAATVGVICALVSFPLIGLLAIGISKFRKRLKNKNLETSNNQNSSENK